DLLVIIRHRNISTQIGVIRCGEGGTPGLGQVEAMTEVLLQLVVPAAVPIAIIGTSVVVPETVQRRGEYTNECPVGCGNTQVELPGAAPTRLGNPAENVVRRVGDVAVDSDRPSTQRCQRCGGDPEPSDSDAQRP